MIWMLWMAMQAAVAAITPVVPCSVVDVRPADAPAGGAGLLVVGCGTHGVPLGAASRYSAVWSPAVNGLLVVRVRGAKTQVLLVSPTQGGTWVAVNDLTRELVGLTGKSPNLELGAAKIDTTRFALDGSVGVIATGVARRLDVKPYTLRAAQKLVSTAPAAVDAKN